MTNHDYDIISYEFNDRVIVTSNWMLIKLAVMSHDLDSSLSFPEKQI